MRSEMRGNGRTLLRVRRAAAALRGADAAQYVFAGAQFGSYR